MRNRSAELRDRDLERSNNSATAQQWLRCNSTMLRLFPPTITISNRAKTRPTVNLSQQWWWWLWSPFDSDPPFGGKPDAATAKSSEYDDDGDSRQLGIFLTFCSWHAPIPTKWFPCIIIPSPIIAMMMANVSAASFLHCRRAALHSTFVRFRYYHKLQMQTHTHSVRSFAFLAAEANNGRRNGSLQHRLGMCLVKLQFCWVCTGCGCKWAECVSVSVHIVRGSHMPT